MTRLFVMALCLILMACAGVPGHDDSGPDGGVPDTEYASIGELIDTLDVPK